MKLTSDLADETVLSALGERIARLRVEANLTQAALAHQAGVSKSTVERLEAGAGCELTRLIRVLRVLGLVEGFDTLIPELPPSPLAELELRGKQRRRARTTRTSAPPSDAPRKWTWGEK
jgi:transcriptional regulator with XRE-family HTH domain